MSSFLGALMNHGVPAVNSGLLWTRASSRTRWTLVCTAYVFVCVRVCERSRERAMRRIWEPCSFVGQQGVCTVCFPTFYIFMYPHLQIAVSVDALHLLHRDKYLYLAHHSTFFTTLDILPLLQPRGVNFKVPVFATFTFVLR